MKGKKIALMACVLSLLSGCDKPSDSASEQPVLRVGATPDGYPHYFVQDGEVQGFSADILQAVADKIHYKVEWVTSDWVGVLGSLETGKVDTVGNFADTRSAGKSMITASRITTPLRHWRSVKITPRSMA
ncbi:hypothetical protein ERHA55_52940 (plasmid) [Erwinia rhapontici]|nr:hypothetical protein ERHA55_52940 [Erwinia rhapontici]